MKKVGHIVIFYIVLLSVSAIIGYIYGINNYFDLAEYLGNLNNPNNMFLYHIIIIFIFLFSTLSLLGIFIHSVLIGFEGISIGYVLSVFYVNYKFKGILYAIVTILINKGIFLIILLYLFHIGIRYLQKSFNNIIGTNKDYVDYLIKPIIKKYIAILIIVLIYDTIIYFFGNTFLSYLTFML